MQETLSLPLLLTAGPLASQQQIAHALGHPPEPGLTESPLGLESPARPGFGLRPNPGEKAGGNVLANTVRYIYIYI